MRDLPRVIGSVCVIAIWFMTASLCGIGFGVMLASTIQGGITW